MTYQACVDLAHDDRVTRNIVHALRFACVYAGWGDTAGVTRALDSARADAPTLRDHETRARAVLLLRAVEIHTTSGPSVRKVRDVAHESIGPVVGPERVTGP